MSRWIVALVVAVVLAGAGQANAAITYSIVDYPSSQIDFVTGVPCTISGTIITNGKIGTLTTSDIVGGSWTITNPNGSVTNSIMTHVKLNGVTASLTSLALPPGPAIGFGNFFDLDTSFDRLPHTDRAILNYVREYNPNIPGGWENVFSGSVIPDLQTWQASAYFCVSDAIAPPGQSLLLGGTDPWVIATAVVPEPSSLIVWSSLGAVGLVMLWRHRRVKSAA